MTHLDLLQETIEAAVKRCISPGTCLQISGGLDSAIIQAVAQLDSLYCATWPDEDNLTAARKAALGHLVVPVTFTYDEMVEVLPRIAKLTDGNGTWSQVCQWFLCKKAAEDGCKAVVTGEGADELFGGYARYRILYWLDRIYADPLLCNYRSIIDHQLGRRSELVPVMLSRTSSAYEMSKMGNTSTPETESLVSHMMKMEFKNSLPSLLKYGEAMARDHGLECRFPYMDTEIIRFTATLKDNEKVDEHFNKVILRQLAKRLGIDPDIITETTKKGLYIPQSWAPVGHKPWSRNWFIGLMEEAYISSRGGSAKCITTIQSVDGGAAT